MAVISETVNFDILEKKEDGTFKKKHPETKASQVKFADGSTVESHKADYEYQVATVFGKQIRLTKQSGSKRLHFELKNSIIGVNITISLDGGATEKILRDIEGVQVTELEKGFVEVVAEASFFTLRAKGGKKVDDVNHTITSQNGQYLIPKGQHSGDGMVKATFSNLLSRYIKSGITIGGIRGSLAVPTKVAVETVTLNPSSGAYTRFTSFQLSVVMAAFLYSSGDTIHMLGGFSQETGTYYRYGNGDFKVQVNVLPNGVEFRSASSTPIKLTIVTAVI